MSNNVVYDWGQTPPTAPTTKRADPLGWLCASAVFGLVVGLLALVVVWRPLPGLAGPPGSLAEHLSAWWRLALHWLWGGAYSHELKGYLGAVAQLDEQGRNALRWREAFAAIAACLPAVLMFRSFLTPRDSLIHLRGAMRHEGAEAVEHLNGRLAGRVKRRPDHEIAPGVPYPADMWTRHVLVVGGVGSGKSTAIKPLIDKVVASREPMILFDPKGEFTSGFGKPVLIAPWDKRSCSWDVAKDMRNIGDMRRFAAAMIREGTDPMWANASRQILVGFMIYLKRTRGSRWGWSELADLVAMPQGNLLPLMAKYHPEAIRAVERASVTTHGILINLSSFCASIFDLAEAWGDVPENRRISFVEWTRGKARYPQVILQGHGAYAELTKGYVEGIVGVIAALINSVEMEDDPNRKLWFIADEFGQMGKIPIRPLFEVGRSRGVRCVVACQDLAQLEEVHGALMVKALVSMSGTVLVGQMMQGETAEQMAKALGTREVERPNVSSSYAGTGGSSNRSTTVSFARDEIAIYKPSELASRLGLTPDDKGVKLALFTGGHAYELFWPKYEMRRERTAHVPAAWTLGVELDEEDEAMPASQDDAKADAQIDAVMAIDEPPVSAPADPSDGHIDDGERRDASEAAKSQDADAVPSKTDAAATASLSDAPGIEEVGRWLRESVEVTASSNAPSNVGAGPGHGGHMDRDVLMDAAVEGRLHAIGGEAIATGSTLIQVLETIEDGRPGPKQEVRVVQRPSAMSTQAGEPASRSSTKPAMAPTVK